MVTPPPFATLCPEILLHAPWPAQATTTKCHKPWRLAVGSSSPGSGGRKSEGLVLMSTAWLRPDDLPLEDRSLSLYKATALWD